MYIVRVLNIILLLAIGYLTWSCAIIQPPPGGTKDTTPPKINGSQPLIGSTNFSDNKIVFEFDEFVTLKNIQQEFIASPPLQKIPEFKLSGKKLTITFDEELKPNTTYTMSLGSGIVDYTEGNILDSNSMVFSTGNDIDSGMVSGQVQFAKSRSFASGVLVMLYSDGNDSIACKERPVYYSKTDKNGNFKINYIKKGSYYIYALEDKNANYLYDLPNEKIGFYNNSVSIGEKDSTDSNLKLSIFEENKGPLYCKGHQVESYGKILVGFSKPVKKPSFVPLNKLDSDFTYQLKFDENKDTLWLWTSLRLKEKQTLKLQVLENNSPIDTLEITPKEYPEKVEELIPTIAADFKGGVVAYFGKSKLKVNSPFELSAFNGYLATNGDTQKIKAQKIGFNELEISNPLKQESKYHLFINKGSVENIFGLPNDSFDISFRTLSDVEYADLLVNINGTTSDQTIIELLDSKGEVLKEELLNNSKSIKFKRLAAGKYGIRLIFDENKNGKWDNGSFIPRRQPERIVIYSGEVEMKEGWDKKIDWTIPE